MTRPPESEYDAVLAEVIQVFRDVGSRHPAAIVEIKTETTLGEPFAVLRSERPGTAEVAAMHPDPSWIDLAIGTTSYEFPTGKSAERRVAQMKTLRAILEAAIRGDVEETTWESAGTPHRTRIVVHLGDDRTWKSSRIALAGLLRFSRGETRRFLPYA